MFIQLQQIVPSLLHYKYLIIFPIAIFEGPILTIICGFLASSGFLNLFLGLAVVIVGDLTGDSIYYLIGKFGRHKFIFKYGKFLGITAERLKKMEKHFKTHPNKTFILGKVTHGPGTLVLIAAGLAKVPYKKFILSNISPTIVKSALLILIGYYFGNAYLKFNHYLNYAALFFSIAVILIAIYVYYIRRNTKALNDD
jgi:membrane-associated protein